MSVQTAAKRKTAPEIFARKNGEPIVMLTSYHAHTAALVDQYCDIILVGDSLGNVMHGFETTVPVTLEMMILQGHAVMRGSKQAMVVVDMPFGSYEESPAQAFRATPATLGDRWGAEPEERWGRVHRGDAGEVVPSLPGAWSTFYPAVAAAVRGSGPVPVRPEDAVATATVLDAARRSAGEGRTVELAG